MLLKSLVYIPSIIGVLGIGTFVAFRSRQAAFKAYTAFSFSLALWLSLQYLIDSHVSNGRLWLQLASIALTAMASSFVLFVYTFPNRRLPNLSWMALLFLPVLFFIPISFTSLYLRSVAYSQASVIVEAGLLFSVQTGVLLVYSLSGIYILTSRIRHSGSVLRSQILLLIFAFIIGVVGMVLAGFIFPNSPYWQLARPIAVLMMLAIIAYAMIYRRLFDIRSYVFRGVAYFVTLSVMTALFVVLAIVPSSYLLHSPLQSKTMAYLGFVTLVVAVLFQPLKNFFNKTTNKLFYRDFYDPQDLLDGIGGLLVGTVDLKEIETEASRIITQSLKPTHLDLLLSKEIIPGNKVALDALNHSQIELIVADELDTTTHATLYKLLQKRDVSLAFKLQTTHENLGFMLLGPRQSGALYTAADKRVLRTIADELAIGLQNALRFKEIEEFNKTLQQKVDDKTRSLQHANDKLRKMDQTKDDFISMASHQLRTPLTSVKGYVSMVLDGDVGALNRKQRDYLNQVFVSSQRMSYLISDLLNVSRLRTGKFIIDRNPCNLANVIHEEVSQLVETAKARELELIYHQPEHFPTLMLDEMKMRQVIMNFIDNAIYYTPSGGSITVTLTESSHSIEFTVTDTGIGVPRAEQHHLFSKFFRAQNARVARPDGTGLGLFMAKKVVTAQGGAIIFKSREGKGSTFGFTMPKTVVGMKDTGPKKIILHS